MKEKVLSFRLDISTTATDILKAFHIITVHLTYFFSCSYFIDKNIQKVHLQKT